MAMSTDRRNIKVQDDGTINGDGGKLQPNYINSSAIQNRMEQKAHKYYTTAASKKPIQHASRLFSQNQRTSSLAGLNSESSQESTNMNNNNVRILAQSKIAQTNELRQVKDNSTIVDQLKNNIDTKQTSTSLCNVAGWYIRFN